MAKISVDPEDVRLLLTQVPAEQYGVAITGPVAEARKRLQKAADTPMATIEIVQHVWRFEGLPFCHSVIPWCGALRSGQYRVIII